MEYTSSYSPATISGNVTCAGSTVNGWCTSTAQLALSSNEPVAGYAITLMEGTRNGETFACPSGATSCNIPLLEGQNNFTFWALSSWGDSSLMGTASGKVDTQLPSITASLTSTGGENGWYISDVILSALATDPAPGSGMDSFTYTLDSAAPVAFPGSLSLTDGVHTVLLQAMDAAGHVVTLTRSASVDTVVPSSSFTYMPPASGWVRGSVTLTGTSSDVTSGIAQVELSTDGGSTWQPLSGTSTWSFLWDTTTLADGAHLILARARDVAGNQESTASLTLNVDNTPPQATLDAPASFCPSCGTASLTYAVDDASSGLVSWDLSVDGTSLASGTTSVMDTLTWDGSGLPLGAHTLTLIVTDLAGNITNITTSITLEAAPPVELPAEKPSFFWFLATKTPSPTPTATQAVSTPTATRTQVVETFAAVPPVAATSPDSQSPDSELPASSILWGAAAAGVIAAATAYSLEEKRKREEEEARQRAEMERQNAEARAREQAEAALTAARKKALEEQQEQYLATLAAQQTQAEKDYLDWLRTGKNPPPGMSDITEAERLTVYQQTDQYQVYQARIAAWEEKQQQYQTWLRTGANPPTLGGFNKGADKSHLHRKQSFSPKASGGIWPIVVVGVFTVLVLGGIYLRYKSVKSVNDDPILNQEVRDEIGGAIIVEYDQMILEQAREHDVPDDLIASVIRHESGAAERRFFGSGWLANIAEYFEAVVRSPLGNSASIGIGQVQVVRAQELEDDGYVSPSKNLFERINRLLTPSDSIEYIAGNLEYYDDTLTTTYGSYYSTLDTDDQYRLMLIGYNEGWDSLIFKIDTMGVRATIELSNYDNLTLDSYERWKDEYK